jgi:hypothetical protein
MRGSSLSPALHKLEYPQTSTGKSITVQVLKKSSIVEA